jgi:hypothetical protein
MTEEKPPRSITIAAGVEPAQSEPNPTRPRRKTAEEYRKVWRGKRSKPKVAQQQPIIVPDGEPPFRLFVLGFMTVFGSIGFSFWLENVYYDSQLYDLLYDNVCCFFCNGIAIGLGIIGFYCIQYRNWKHKNGAYNSAVLWGLGAGFLILVSIACFWFWLEMDNWW